MQDSIFKRAKSVYEKTIGVAIILALWELLPRTGIINPNSLPPFTGVAGSLAELVASGKIYAHLYISLSRSFMGFLLAVLLGVPLGFALGWFKRAARIGDPLLQFLRNTPALALYPMFILLLGFTEFSKIAIIFYGTFWPILINSTGGVKSLNPIYVKAARGMGVRNLTLFRKVIFPAAFPFIVTGFRLGATRAILLLVGAEMLGADEGLGFLIFDTQHAYEIPTMYAVIVVFVILGLLVNSSLVLLEKKVTRWKENINVQ